MNHVKENDFFEELKKYFENTPREKVLEDWAKTEELDEIGPTIEEFLQSSFIYGHGLIDDPLLNKLNLLDNFVSPKYSSGFSF